MKKLVCMTLAFCLAVSLLSGCGGNKEEENQSSAVSGPLATVSPSPTPAPQKAKAVRVTADSGLNVRAEASTEGDILGLVENGDRLALMLEDAQDGWYQVQYQGKTAYVSADYVEVIEVTVEEYNQLKDGSTEEKPEESSSSSSSASTSSSDETSSQSSSSTSSNSASTDEEDGE